MPYKYCRMYFYYVFRYSMLYFWCNTVCKKCIIIEYTPDVSTPTRNCRFYAKKILLEGDGMIIVHELCPFTERLVACHYQTSSLISRIYKLKKDMGLPGNEGECRNPEQP